MAMELRVEQGLSRRSALEPNSLDEALRLAEMAVKSRLYNVQSAEAALMILLTGRDLGMSASQSLRGIYVVSNKPVVSADALIAAVKQSGYCESWSTVETTVERCTIETKRKGEKRSEIETWTMEDARRAGLAHKDVWKNYPRTMLRHRTAAELARRVYPDVCLGIYVQGEMRDDDQVASRLSVPVEVVVEQQEAQAPAAAQKIVERLLTQIGQDYGDHARGHAECWLENLRDLSEEFDHADLQDAKIEFTKNLIKERFKFWDERALPLVHDEQSPTVFGPLYRGICEATTDEALVKLWNDHKHTVNALEKKEQKEIAYNMVVYRYGEIHPEESQPTKAFKKLLTTPTPPDGTNGTKSKNNSSSAAGTSAEAAPAAGAQASVSYLVPLTESARFVASADEWSAHCAAYKHREHAHHSWAKHCAAFRAAGEAVYRERLHTAAERIQALVSAVSPEPCKIGLLNAERTAQANARKHAEAATTLRKAG